MSDFVGSHDQAPFNHSVDEIIFGIGFKGKHIEDFGEPSVVIAFLRAQNYQDKANEGQRSALDQEIKEFEDSIDTLKQYAESARDEYFQLVVNAVQKAFKSVEEISQGLVENYKDVFDYLSDNGINFHVYGLQDNPEVIYSIDKTPLRKQFDVYMDWVDGLSKVEVQVSRVKTKDGYGIVVNKVDFYKEPPKVQFRDKAGVLAGGTEQTKGDKPETEAEALELLSTEGSIEDRYRSMLAVYDAFVDIGRGDAEIRDSFVSFYATFKGWIDTGTNEQISLYKRILDEGVRGEHGGYYKQYVAVVPGSIRKEWISLLKDIVQSEIDKGKIVDQVVETPPSDPAVGEQAEQRQEYQAESKLRGKESAFRKRFFDWCRVESRNFSRVEDVQRNWIKFCTEKGGMEMFYVMDHSFFDESRKIAYRSIERDVILKDGTKKNIFVQTIIGTRDDGETGDRRQVVYYSDFAEM
ncbi:hypothetical protein HOF40_03075 [Candidatus Parcubacteria bacterium]|nr:hypothetical protein [Candidatus Parcubacteria bacterium]